MKPWQKTILVGSATSALTGAGYLIWSFLTVAVPSHAQDAAKEKRLSDVEQVAVKLGAIHDASEAKRQQTIEYCNTGIITKCRVCQDVGIDIKECH